MRFGLKKRPTMTRWGYRLIISRHDPMRLGFNPYFFLCIGKFASESLYMAIDGAGAIASVDKVLKIEIRIPFGRCLDSFVHWINNL